MKIWQKAWSLILGHRLAAKENIASRRLEKTGKADTHTHKWQNGCTLKVFHWMWHSSSTLIHTPIIIGTRKICLWLRIILACCQSSIKSDRFVLSLIRRRITTASTDNGNQKQTWLRVIKARDLQLSRSLRSSNIRRRSISHFRKLLEGSHTCAILWSDRNVQISKLFVGILCILKSSVKKNYYAAQISIHAGKTVMDRAIARSRSPPPSPQTPGLSFIGFIIVNMPSFWLILSHYYLFLSSAYSLKLNYEVLRGF